jgi:hypothetical protein
MTKDKKQILVLGVLFAVILAVGAFQFMGGSKPKTTAKEDDKKSDSKDVVAQKDVKDPTEKAVEQLFMGALVSRDPFVPQAVIIDEPEGQLDDPNKTGGLIQRPDPMQGGNNGGGTTGGPVDVYHPPVDPNQVGLQPTDTPRDAWSLRGVMAGRKVIAILEDHKGKQFLVKEGDTFNDGHTTVLSITKTHVELMHNGKVTTLALLGGN